MVASQGNGCICAWTRGLHADRPTCLPCGSSHSVVIRLPVETLRFEIAGGTVAGLYIAVPLVLNGFGVKIEIAIAIAYLLAVSLHFTLQRYFVFRHVETFALSVRQQIGRYVVVGAVQYPTTAAATALLPGAIGVSQRAAFVGWTLVISSSTFLIFRRHVFHPGVRPDGYG